MNTSGTVNFDATVIHQRGLIQITFTVNMNGRSDEMKVVYLWKNGQAIIVQKNEEDEYVYPDENGLRTNLLKALYYLAIMTANDGLDKLEMS